MNQPRITNRRTQRTLHAALERARLAQDKALVTHIAAILNGAKPLPGGRR